METNMARPVRVAEVNMESFVSKLKLDIPASIKVHNMAVNVLSGRWPYSEFWVDCWPDFNGAIAVANKDAAPSFQNTYVLYGTKTSVKFLLNHCVKWDPPLSFYGLHENLYPTLIEATQSRELVETASVDTDLFVESGNHVNRPILMEEYATKSPYPEQLHYVLKHWPRCNWFENPSEFIGTLLSCFPTLGVLDCHGDLAGHAGLYHYGAVAFLRVDEKHQRKGLGKFLLSEMIRISSQSGIIPHSNITRGNTASLQLHHAAGLQLTGLCDKFLFYESKALHTASTT